MERITLYGIRSCARRPKPRSGSNIWQVKRLLHASSMAKTEWMWVKVWIPSIKWCIHLSLKASAPKHKIRRVILSTIITVVAIVTALTPGSQDSQRPMCSRKPLVKSSKKSDLSRLKAPLQTLPQLFHVRLSSLIASWKRLLMLIGSRMSIVRRIGSEIKLKNARSYRCRALAEWSVQ